MIMIPINAGIGALKSIKLNIETFRKTGIKKSQINVQIAALIRTANFFQRIGIFSITFILFSTLQSF